MEILKVGTTFSGIGSPEQALKNLKIPHVVKWACDIDKNCKETYFNNHTCEKWYDDISKIDLDNLEHVDLYVFGFPCQDLSTAGNQNLIKGRSMLVTYSLDIIDKLLPKYILFENVKGLLNKKFSDFYQMILMRIIKNYKFQLLKLNSKDFGIPHNRERVFGIGIRKDIDEDITFKFEHKKSHFKYFLEDEVNCKYFVSDSRRDNIINTALNKQVDFSLKEDFGEVKQANKNGLFGDKKIRYSGNIFCQNLIDRHGFIYPDMKIIRLFTPRECARLQGFPDTFIIPDKDRIAFKQFGNTITVNVLEQIFKNLFNQLN